MTEKEKQQAGELYNGNDRELFAERIAAKKLCAEYNAVPYNDFQKRDRLLDRLIAFHGENTWIEANFFCDYGYNIVMGDNFYSNHNLVILDCAEVIFGDNVFIGPNCGFYTAGHPLDYPTRNQGLEFAKPIKVGSNVWIGGNVCVMPGVTIGDNVVIGGGSVVTKDIPSGYVAAGNPCKPIRRIEDGETAVQPQANEEAAASEAAKVEPKTEVKLEDRAPQSRPVRLHRPEPVKNNVSAPKRREIRLEEVKKK